MSIIDAIILGLIQGVTEFLPISSSGHLVLASRFLGLDDSFTFSVLLNIGSLVALVIFYRHKILEIIKRLFTSKEWAFILKLIIATIPAGLVGWFLADKIEFLNSLIWVVITMLILIGLAMIFISRPDKQADNRPIEESISYNKSIMIGLSQVLALIPGTSRSGITILTGIRSKLSVEKAAEFSFLMAIPIITGAILKVLLSSEGVDFISQNLSAFLFGNLVCFVAGYIAIEFLIKLIARKGLKDFGWYRIGLATILMLLVVFKVI